MPAFTPATPTKDLLAGSYWHYEAEPPRALPVAAIGRTVAIPATADWGPINTAVPLSAFERMTAVFGKTATPLRRGVFGAFKGQGLPGRPGASTVLAYRLATPAAAKATRTLQNATPAVAITFTARFHGTRGNDFRFTVQPSAVSGKKDLLILDGALIVEKYTFTPTDVAALAADVSAQSAWFAAVANITGVALSDVSAQQASGGNNGDSITGTEWLAAQTALDAHRWSVVAAYGVTDSGIRAAVAAWIDQRNAAGRRSRAVVGGLAGEDLATANARSVALNNWEIVNLGVGTVRLDDLAVDASTAEFTARFAGALANAGEKRDVIYMRFADVSLTAAPSLADEKSALASGTTIFTRDTHAAAPVFVREGVTTYSNDGQSPVDQDGVKKYPVSLYRRIKNLAIQHGIELEVDEWATAGGVFGDLPVNDRVRNLILGRVALAYSTREEAEILQPGWVVQLDPDVPVSDDDDFVAYQHGYKPTRALRLLLNNVKMG